jgi:hypothetical protein
LATFNRLSFKATHNSYSGNIKGTRGGITDQLDSGVRLIELDIHTDDFATLRDYQIGHDGGPGDETWHSDGNPASNLFTEWLALIAEWSAQNRDHAPIQVVLDVKSTLALPSPDVGNHGALNAILRKAFGNSLLLASEFGDWPDSTELGGAIIVVMSGLLDSRVAYARDHGVNTAVSVNSSGQVVEVHESEQGNNTLWYWAGERKEDGTILWHQHGRYGTGTTPSVAINDAGLVVEVHKSQNHDRLWWQVGRLNADFSIDWGPSHDYDNGISPTIRFVGPSGVTLREIHQSQAHTQNWDWNVTLDPATLTLQFADNGKTLDPRWFSRAQDDITVWADENTLLLYSTASVDRALIRHEQVAFIEYQPSEGDPHWIGRIAKFAAAPASDTNRLTSLRLAGYVTRGWQFDEGSPQLQPPENYLATDTPSEPWYTAYCISIGAQT